MMRKLITAVFITNLVSLAICNSNPETAESRINVVRSPTASVGTTSHLNSLQSSQDPLLAKAQQALQQQQQPQPQQQTQQLTQQQQQTLTQPQTYTRISTDYSGISHTHSPLYTHVQQNQATPPSGGYFIQVNPQGGQSAASFGSGPTPVIMQYLPHNAQSGPIQYLQLIPTRPLIVPISPYISNQYSPFGQTQSQPTTAAANYPALQSPHHSYQTSASTHNYNTYQPTLQSPIGGYSNNYLSYFRPNPGMQLVTSPVDLSLNTNEYLPIQSESSYKVRRP